MAEDGEDRRLGLGLLPEAVERGKGIRGRIVRVHGTLNAAPSTEKGPFHERTASAVSDERRMRIDSASSYASRSTGGVSPNDRLRASRPFSEPLLNDDSRRGRLVRTQAEDAVQASQSLVVDDESGRALVRQPGCSPGGSHVRGAADGADEDAAAHDAED